MLLIYRTQFVIVKEPSMTGPDMVKFPQVLGRLMEERYKRNRAALASAAHISASALSQYVRGRATPSLAVLVDLAQALEVSLDFLVYGQDALSGADHTAWAQHLEDTIRRMTSEAASLRQLVDRIGIDISARLYEVATDVVKHSGARGGALTAAEVVQVERYSRYTRIAAVDLDTEVLLPRESSPDAIAAPGPFADVVAANILAGDGYEYIIPDSPQWIRRARLIIKEVRKALECQVGSRESDSAVAKNLHFFAGTEGLVPSYVIYILDRVSLQREKPLLYDLIEGFLGTLDEETDDPDIGGGSTLALVEPSNPGFDMYPLISRDSLPMLGKSYQKLRNQSDRLSFTDHHTSPEG
jgi:transcriptional regulator with XRE-family HTH domain